MDSGKRQSERGRQKTRSVEAGSGAVHKRRVGPSPGLASRVGQTRFQRTPSAFGPGTGGSRSPVGPGFGHLPCVHGRVDPGVGLDRGRVRDSLSPTEDRPVTSYHRPLPHPSRSSAGETAGTVTDRGSGPSTPVVRPAGVRDPLSDGSRETDTHRLRRVG